MSSITNLRRHIFMLEPEVVFGLTFKEVEATVSAMKECGVYKMPHDNGVAVQLMTAAEDRLFVERWHLSDTDRGMKRLPPLEHMKLYNEAVIRRSWRQIDVDLDLTVDEVRCLTLRRLPRNARRLHARDRVFYTPENFERIVEHGEEIVEVQIGLRNPNCPPDKVEVNRHSAEQRLADLRDILIVSLCSKGIIRETRQINHNVPGPIEENSTTITRISLPPPPASEPQGGTHASPRLHLRRGHVTHQRFGPGREQTKLLFIEPTWVNADAEFSVRRIKSHEVAK